MYFNRAVKDWPSVQCHKELQMLKAEPINWVGHSFIGDCGQNEKEDGGKMRQKLVAVGEQMTRWCR